MLVIPFTLNRPRAAPVPADGTVTAALRAAALLHEGPEHLRVHESRAGARGVLFAIAPSMDAARALCLAVCARAIAETPELTGWLVDVL
ncbi:hypothetical protein ABTZ03_24660 [Kitasatospora sp. NPDC096077]|uniref:hypothetical protein n=1 Tax=Kitasatospora sp. NPDC096077 TaxID=3155544 RepID=UPI0033253A11